MNNSPIQKSPIQTPRRKRQKILLIVLGLVILATVGFLVWQYRGGVAIPEEFLPTLPKEEIEKAELDLTILTDPLFTALKSYGDLPVLKGITGRSNPFLHW